MGRQSRRHPLSFLVFVFLRERFAHDEIHGFLSIRGGMDDEAAVLLQFRNPVLEGRSSP